MVASMAMAVEGGVLLSEYDANQLGMDRQATQESSQDCAGDGQGEGGDIEGQEEVGGAGRVLVRACSKEVGAACLYVPKSCSRILWRIGNARPFTSLSMVSLKDWLNCFISLLNKSTEKSTNEAPPTSDFLLFS